MPMYRVSRRCHILVTAGIQEARFLSLQVLGERFGGVILPQVVHPGVRKAAAVRTLKLTIVPVEGTLGLLPAVQAWRAALETGDRLLFVESPSRLTGAIYRVDELHEIAALIDSHEAAIIWEQGLLPWTAPSLKHSLIESVGAAEHAAVIGELWPGLGLENWHIGFIAAPPAWIEEMRVLKQIMSICTSTAVQFAALEAADGFEHAARETQARLAGLRENWVEQLNGGPVELMPGDTATIVAVRPPDISRTLSELSNAGFSVADGAAFGAPGLLRNSILPDGEHERALPLLLRLNQGATHQ
jgi:aspartate/methionine/tyrosine aminotransferase